ncbi:MAG: hypothetical protein EOO40_11040 [Deltaproteobacteria bacterium]|nr:MAG: hypothetical protein EOO40_11040 [Deltaproteobacteria bacterium]
MYRNDFRVAVPHTDVRDAHGIGLLTLYFCPHGGAFVAPSTHIAACELPTGVRGFCITGSGTDSVL